MNNPAEYIRK